MKNQSHSRALAAGVVLPLFFLLILGGGALLGPVFALLCRGVIPFHRVMDRALLGAAVLALALFRRRLPWHRLWPRRRAAIHWAFGLFIALVALQALLGLYAATVGFHRADLSPAAQLRVVGLALVAALLVPFAEETIFRGFVPGELLRLVPPRLAVVLSALIFMLAHFVKIPVTWDQVPIQAGSGWAAIGAALLPLAQGTFLSGHGLTLFVLGLLLGGLARRAGQLWTNAGLHSGLIGGLLIFSGLTRANPSPRVPWLAGDLLSTPLSAAVLFMLSLWLWRYYPASSDIRALGSATTVEQPVRP